MMAEFAAALEATALARALRGSVWLYPLVNAGHILGVALLVGAIVPLDLRLLGLWPSLPPAALYRVLTRTATAGLMLAVVCGALLFAARATEYVQSSLFIAKMFVVAAGLINALALRWAEPELRLPDQPGANVRSLRVRIAAIVSLMVWPAALVLGRLIGYF